MMTFGYLDSHADRHPDAEFAVCAGRRLTYGEAKEAANRVASSLIAAGLRPGDRIATIMKNSVEVAILYFGAFKAGVVPTPISHRLTPREWREICDDSEARLLVCDHEFLTDLDRFRDELSTVRECIVVGDPPPGWRKLEDWIGERPTTPPAVSLSAEHEALQMYTSGTTGKPRGVVLTHRAITACIGQLEQVLRFRATDRFLMVMPLFHAAGTIVMLQAVAGGASLLIQKCFHPKDVVEALDAEDVSVAMMAPTMIQTCLTDVADIAERRFTNLRLIIYGGSPMAEATLRQAMSLFQCDFAQRYGSTETLCLTWLKPEDHRLALEGTAELLHSAGQPLPGVELRVIDGNQQVVPGGQLGEIIVAGPQLMKQYWKLDDDGDLELDGKRFIRTGDCGTIDADNYVYLSDRSDDVIISGGENIYPREIEDVLILHSDIDQAAVIGVPDPKWGESLKAVVVRRSGADLSADDLIGFCRQHLAGFKTPRSVNFVSELPRNAAGKILRSRLRESYRRR